MGAQCPDDALLLSAISAGSYYNSLSTDWYGADD
jgi:hypothetical protein